MIIHIDATAIVEVISFGVFFWLLNTILYQPVTAIFRQRGERIEAGLRAAEEAQRHAEEAQREMQRRLEQARVEAQGLIAAANKQAGARRQSLLEQARGEAEALLAQAQDEVRRERGAAVELLRREAAPLAILIASKVAGSSLDNPGNRALADRAVAEAGASSVGQSV